MDHEASDEREEHGGDVAEAVILKREPIEDPRIAGDPARASVASTRLLLDGWRLLFHVISARREFFGVRERTRGTVCDGTVTGRMDDPFRSSAARRLSNTVATRARVYIPC